MKYRHFIFFVMATLACHILHSQASIASLTQDGKLTIRPTSAPLVNLSNRKHQVGPSLKAGYPLVFRADPAFKNFRNVTLHDLNEDGADEIIMGIANQLLVFSHDTLWWSNELSGLARFPAAVGDIDNDGSQDIVILTGFNDEPGQVYSFESNGTIKSGWPMSFDGNWMISSPALFDLDKDGGLEIICGDLHSGAGNLYVLSADGTPFSNEWPLPLPNIPAVTPSIGDLDHDGVAEIVISTTREIYALDQEGKVKPGWPFSNGETKFSYQSPVLSDLGDDGTMEVVAAGHGDLPLYLALDASGKNLPGWPQPVPFKQWTYQTPTVIDYQGERIILTGRPIGSEGIQPMLFAFKADGRQLQGFPIVKSDGLEGLITVADLDGDLNSEIVFSSNTIDSLGRGYIHAYHLDGSGIVEGFPLQMYGWTFMNGATLGDVDGNGLLDMAVLTYTEHVGSEPDSAFLYVYEFATASRNHIQWPTYKGSNLRNGNPAALLTAISNEAPSVSIHAFPNPASTLIHFNGGEKFMEMRVHDRHGRTLLHKTGTELRPTLFIGDLQSGIYFAHIKTSSGIKSLKFIKH